MSDQPNEFTVEYHPPDAPWPWGIKRETFENCNSKEEAINRFIEAKVRN